MVVLLIMRMNRKNGGILRREWSSTAVFVVKLYGRGADQPSKCVQVFSSPIIHNLFNDSSWCNE